MKTVIKYASFSLAGIGKINEDALGFQVLENGASIALIADGVGGNYGGKIASTLAVKVVLDTMISDPATALGKAFSDASEALKKRGAEDLISGQMATTLSLCLIDIHGRVSIAHVGDSRIYHLREKGIIQKTKDQTEVAALIEAGILTNEQAKTYPRRTVLRSALAAKGTYQIFKDEFNLEKGDRILLLTDGVYRLVTKMKLRDLSLRSATIEIFLNDLKAEILESNDDDATLILIEATQEN